MNFNEFLSLAVAAIILGIVGYVSAQLIPSVKDWFKLHLSEKDRDLLNAIFNEIVQAVEYERLKKAAEGAAFDALEYALALTNLYLARYGIELNATLIEAMLRKYLASEIKWGDEPKTDETLTAKVESNRYWA